jgi:hypothetical protein
MTCPDLIAAIVSALGINPGDDESEDQSDGSATLKSGIKTTTSALAAKLKPGTGAELFKLALAKLQLSDDVEPATRAQIHNEMKTATKFYKPNMKNNLNNMIDTLLGQGAINEPETGSYALTQATLEELQTKLQP